MSITIGDIFDALTQDAEPSLITAALSAVLRAHAPDSSGQCGVCLDFDAEDDQTDTSWPCPTTTTALSHLPGGRIITTLAVDLRWIGW